MEDLEHCYRAVQSRDPRFDGWFFTAVTSTGIYCRPSCPARTPHRANVRFYPSAAAAQQAGFRACLRCRPDASPGSPQWNIRADVAARAMRLIADGTVDREGVVGLARRLAYSTRQLQRVLVAETGASAGALARAQRAQTARLLIETTDLAMADVAFAAGFSSVRQFNDTVRDVMGRTPSELRRRHRGAGAASRTGDRLCLRLPYRQPMACGELLGFLGARAVAGVEAFVDGVYARTLRLPHGHGTVRFEPADGYVRAELSLFDLRDLTAAVGRCRRLLDLDADPVAVDAALAADPVLAPIVARSPGRRVPGAVDGFEIAVRALVGQQVSLAGACTTARRLADALGAPLDPGVSATPPTLPLTRLFPDATAICRASDEQLPMNGMRRAALRSLARAVADGELTIDPGAEPQALSARLRSVRGIGQWSATYIAMRALGDPDAFLPSDLGIRRAMVRLGHPDTPAAALERAEAWRPWRAYAMAHLWALDGQPAAPRRTTAKEAA